MDVDMDRQRFLEQLRELPTGWGQQDCIICTGNFETEKQVRLPCHREHTIGLDCLRNWLQNHNTCPFCRYEFFPMEIEWEESETDTDEGEEYESEDADDEDFYHASFYYTCPDCGTVHHNEECWFCNEMEEIWEEEESAEGLEDLQTLCHIISDALGIPGPNHSIKEVAALIASGLWHTEAIQGDSSFSNFSVAAACVFMATHLTCRPISGGRIGYRRYTTKHLAFVCPETKESIRAAYRIIHQVRDEVLEGEELLEMCRASDRIRAMHRLPEPVLRSRGEGEPIPVSHR